MRAALALATAAVGAACSASGPGFTCELDAQCTAQQGRCELSGACSAPDDTCGSRRRYSELAPAPLSGACVAAGTPRWLRTCAGPGSEALASLDVRRDAVVAALSYEPGSRGLDGAVLPVFGETDLLLGALAASDGTPRWAQPLGSALQDTLAGARFLSGGDVVAFGRFAEDLTVGGRTLPANNATALLVRLRQDGVPLWASSSSGGGLGGYDAAAALPSEQVLALGAFNAPSSAPFAVGAVTLATGAENDFDAFAALHTGAGQVLAARSFGNLARNDYTGRAAATATRFVTAALFEAPLAGLPAAAPATPGGRLDVLITTWESSAGALTPRASYAAGGAASEQVTAMAADPRGLERFAVAGTSTGAVTFGACASCRVAPPWPGYAWIARFDDTATLAPAQITTLGGPVGRARVLSLALAPDGALIAGGAFEGTVGFGAAGERTADGGDGFVVRVEPGGAVTDVIVFGGVAREQVTAVAVNSDGQVVVGGTFGTGSWLGDVSMTSGGGLDVWVAGL